MNYKEALEYYLTIPIVCGFYLEKCRSYIGGQIVCKVTSIKLKCGRYYSWVEMDYRYRVGQRVQTCTIYIETNSSRFFERFKRIRTL